MSSRSSCTRSDGRKSSRMRYPFLLSSSITDDRRVLVENRLVKASNEMTSDDVLPIKVTFVPLSILYHLFLQ